MLARFALPLTIALFLPAAALADPHGAATSSDTAKTATPAEKAFQLGQLAMERDRFEEAIGQFQLSLRLDPTLAEVRLSLAAAHLALGQDRLAVPQMAAYLDAKPGHFLVRMPFAEVLAKLEQLPQARAQLDRFVADVQEYSSLADDHLIACHTRLMEIAGRQGDEYAERLHRGIGLYLLAEKRVELGGSESARLAEELLCKAAGELTLARMHKPLEARPSYYLYDVWRKLGQNQPATRSLREAEQRAGLSYLTPAELRRLHLATNARDLDSTKR